MSGTAMPAPPTAAANETMPPARVAFMGVISAAVECLANHVARLSRRLCLSVGCQRLEKPDLIDFRLDFSCCRGSLPSVSSSSSFSSSSTSSLTLSAILSFLSFLNPFLSLFSLLALTFAQSLTCGVPLLHLHHLFVFFSFAAAPLFLVLLLVLIDSLFSLHLPFIDQVCYLLPSRFPSTFLPRSFSSPCPCLFLSFDLPVVFPPTLPLLLSSMPFCFSLP